MKNIWINELTKDYHTAGYRVDEVLFSGKSQFQTVDIVESYGYGRVLLNDGFVMVTERDEFVYHDMIAHVPLFTHPNPKKVLVIGGGDGGTAREVLRHESVEECVMVEIDAMVVEACKKFIPQTASCLENPKLKLLIQDAVEYVAQTEKKFDVVLVDSTDPIGPAQPLFGDEFYQNIHNILNEDGIVVSQGESSYYEPEMQESLLKILSSKFPVSTFYNFCNLTYPGMWSFSYASKGPHPVKDFNANRVSQSGLKFEYYNSEIHKSSFAMPSYMRRNLEGLIQL